ncbi:MAG TPA: hypothetical protein EYP57_03255 [Thermodesulfobacteriaceae bacterium]|nr:hypothetical protein [Thermodesulfobacteriaceae bacterium]
MQENTGQQARPVEPGGIHEKDTGSGNVAESGRKVILTTVRLRPEWPVLHYDAGDLPANNGEWVVIPTRHGDEVGQVKGSPVKIQLPEHVSFPRIKRLASTHEIERYYRNLEREEYALNQCAERIHALGLAMKLARVESYFDSSKIVFYYSSDGRVDFRELVRDLVNRLRTRVEMRQIGIRHEAKMVGGLGNCGRELCCAGFLTQFEPVTIKMAKSQNLPLNPSKISGLCGRLLCCLTYEYKTYHALSVGMPNLGTNCETPAGKGKVIRRDILRQRVTVSLENQEVIQFDVSELDGSGSRKKTGRSARSKKGHSAGGARDGQSVPEKTPARRQKRAAPGRKKTETKEKSRGARGRKKTRKKRSSAKSRNRPRSGGRKTRPRSRDSGSKKS